MMRKSILLLICLTLLSGTARPDSAGRLQKVQLEAENGNAPAQNKLGVFYEIGLGVPQDDKEAVKWYRSAAEQGYAEAQFNLGEKYEDGRGVAQDKTIAKAWYKKACDNGWNCGCKKYRMLTKGGY
ncbi:MAG: sel1 repeat family protein [Chlorobiaceae bacterium]|nr:sel1 repeat family protein [Chlorobiaceae bacterium]